MNRHMQHRMIDFFVRERVDQDSRAPTANALPLAPSRSTYVHWFLSVDTLSIE